MAPVEWTAERVAALEKEQIKILRENALRRGDVNIVSLCDEVLAKRATGRAKRVNASAHRAGTRCGWLSFRLPWRERSDPQ